jgi:hypothetical protein
MELGSLESSKNIMELEKLESGPSSYPHNFGAIPDLAHHPIPTNSNDVLKVVLTFLHHFLNSISRMVLL